MSLRESTTVPVPLYQFVSSPRLKLWEKKPWEKKHTIFKPGQKKTRSTNPFNKKTVDNHHWLWIQYTQGRMIPSQGWKAKSILPTGQWILGI